MALVDLVVLLVATALVGKHFFSLQLVGSDCYARDIRLAASIKNLLMRLDIPPICFDVAMDILLWCCLPSVVVHAQVVQGRPEADAQCIDDAKFVSNAIRGSVCLSSVF